MEKSSGYWYGDSPANPGVYTCACCHGTGAVKVGFQARFCGQCKGKGTATESELDLAPAESVARAA